MADIKHYTMKNAKEDVGDSLDFYVGLKATIKKWEEYNTYGERGNRYAGGLCGFCFVAENILEKITISFSTSVCDLLEKVMNSMKGLISISRSNGITCLSVSFLNTLHS